MTYASYDIKCHIMTNDAYDIEIWHKSIWSILVSKRPSGPQQSHPFIRFCLKNCLIIKKLKNASEFFSLYKFWKSFVFLTETVMKSGHRRNHLSEILLVFLGFPDLIQWQNTRVRLANPTWTFLARPKGDRLIWNKHITSWRKQSCFDTFPGLVRSGTDK